MAYKETFCLDCGQGYWQEAGERCSPCEWRHKAEAIDWGWTEDNEFIGVERTALTQTLEAAKQFVRDYAISEEDGISQEALAGPDFLYGSDEVTWWKRGVEPFAGGSEFIESNPSEPTAKAYWSVGLDWAAIAC